MWLQSLEVHARYTCSIICSNCHFYSFANLSWNCLPHAPRCRAINSPILTSEEEENQHDWFSKRLERSLRISVWHSKSGEPWKLVSRGGSFVCLHRNINFAACCRITHFLDFSSVHFLNYLYLIFVGISGYMILQRACDVPNLICYKKEFDSYGTNTPIRRLENKETTLNAWTMPCFQIFRTRFPNGWKQFFWGVIAISNIDASQSVNLAAQIPYNFYTKITSINYIKYAMAHVEFYARLVVVWEPMNMVWI